MHKRIGWLLIGLVVVAATAHAQPQWQVGKPIVTYWAGPDMTDATAQQMAEGNYNVVWCGEKQLDTVQKHGLRAFLHDPLISPEGLDNPSHRAALDQLIERVKNHPAMYAYFIGDEPNSARFPMIGKLFAYLREKDPAHLAYINLFPTYATNEQLGNKGDVVTAYKEHLQQFVDTVKPQLISYDHYHYFVGSDGQQYFLNIGLIREAAMKAGVPFLNIIQAASWDPAVRIPHTNETRWLVNTSIAYGAQGISYYVYCCGGHLGALATPDGKPTPLYYGLRNVNRDFVALTTALQGLTSLGVYHANMEKLPLGAVALPEDAPFGMCEMSEQPVLFGYFGKPGGPPTHVVVVNLDYKSNGIVRVMAPGEMDVFNPAKGTWRPLHERQPVLRLRAGEAKLLRLSGH